MGSNPRDRAHALTRVRGLLAAHPFFSLIFFLQNHLVPVGVTDRY